MINERIIITQFNRLLKERDIILKKIKTYPPGTLFSKGYIHNEKEYCAYYIEYDTKDKRGRKNRTYITKDETLVKTMAKKRYYQEMLLIIEANINALSGVKEFVAPTIDEVMNRLSPQIQNMLEFEKEGRYALPADPEKAQMILEWANQPYVGNPKYPEHLKHTTSTGQLVRSKSEALIYEKLLANKIAFMYEAPIVVGGNIVYPDFSIMRIDNKIFYWEHAGCCFREDYRSEFDWKLKKYEEQGIVLWDNLIVTFDDIDGNIDVRDIDSAIQNKLLI